MSIKYDENTKTWKAFFSKRHPITRIPISLRREKLPTEAEARKAEASLIKIINQKMASEKSPSWVKTMLAFLEFKIQDNWSLKTHQDARFMLEAHTTESWKSMLISAITRQQIVILIQDKTGHRSKTTQQTLLKYIRGVFQFAVEQRLIPSNPALNIRIKSGDKIKCNHSLLRVIAKY